MKAVHAILEKARQAVMRGEPERALEEIEKFAIFVEESPPEDDRSKEQIRTTLAEIHVLAEASLEGATSAAEQIREIVQSARTLQTYDGAGQRCVENTVARMPRRF